MPTPRTAIPTPSKSSPEYVLGIDPGVTGAIWGHSLNGFDDFCLDIPVLELKKGKSVKKEISGILLAQQFTKMFVSFKIAAVGIELIHPTQGVRSVSIAKLLGTTERIRGILDAYSLRFGFSTYAIDPKIWKRHHKLLKTEKDEARKKAIQLLPQYAHTFARKKDHNRADAALIAIYLRHHLEL